MSVGSALANPLMWIGLTFFMLAIVIVMIIFLVILAKKTHAIIEFKAWAKGRIPIAMFFTESRYVEWKPIKPESGLISDKNYGTFIINEKATYVDKRTNNILIPFDAQFGAGINVKAAKLADDLQYISKSEEDMRLLRYSISNNLIPGEKSIEVLKTSVNFGALKTMMTALIPHNIEAKIEKTVASRLREIGKPDWKQFLLPFGGVLFAILIGYLIIRMATKG